MELFWVLIDLVLGQGLFKSTETVLYPPARKTKKFLCASFKF
jgi:hypothetical protein